MCVNVCVCVCVYNYSVFVSYIYAFTYKHFTHFIIFINNTCNCLYKCVNIFSYSYQYIKSIYIYIWESSPVWHVNIYSTNAVVLFIFVCLADQSIFFIMSGDASGAEMTDYLHVFILNSSIHIQ